MLLPVTSVVSQRGRRVPPPSVGGGDPAWYAAANTSEWLALNGGAADTLSAVNPCPANNCSYSSVEGQAGVIDDWCGAVASPYSLLICAQGGHLGYAGNEVYEFVFNTTSPRWHRRVEPSSSQQENVAYYADGKPTSRHGYRHDCYIAAGTNGSRWYAPYGYSAFGNSPGTFAPGASYVLGSSGYDPQGTFPNFPGDINYDAYTAYDPVGHKVYVQETGLVSGLWRLWSLDVATKVWTQHGSSGVLQDGAYIGAFIDPIRRVFVGQSGNTLWIRDIAFPNATGRAYTVAGMSGSAIAYEPVSGKWVNWDGGKTLRVITPPSNYRTGDGSTSNGLNASASYSVGATISPSGGATPTAPNSNGTYGRFAYIAQPHGFCVVNATNQSMYFFKIPAGGI